MPTMIVLVAGKENLDFPAIVEAARVLPKAKALQCDRIRVEKVNGARVAEFPLAIVEQFLATHRLAGQPSQPLRRSQGDYEIHRPVYPGWRKETTA